MHLFGTYVYLKIDGMSFLPILDSKQITCDVLTLSLSLWQGKGMFLYLQGH